MNKISIKSILLHLIILCTAPVYALDLSNANTSLSDIFFNYIDKNEGTTSFRSLNIPSGGRAESMGTAYTGLASDIAFFDYNPAASCILENTEISVAHNAWISDSAVETVAGTARIGNLGFGAQIKCFYVPFTEYNIFGERVAGSYYSETTAAVNASYNFLAGYYFKGIATGVNIKGAWRSIPDYTDNDTNKIIKGSGLSQSGAAFMADFGVLLRFNLAKFYSSREPNLRLGLSLMNLGTAFTGFGSRGKLTRDDPLPSKISAGISYQFIEPVIITADFRQPINLEDPLKSEKWSAGTGASIRFTNFFSFMTGFLIQGANPRISAGGEFKTGKVIINVNYTFDLTTSLNPVNHISLSAKLDLGDRGRGKIRNEADALYAQGLIYYAQGNLQEAFEAWQKVLDLDKSFDPAREGLKAVQTSQSLSDYLINIQSLD
ncbi:UPF0164 family protein [Treponema parvum]|uniref:UPF0164 family protein n=1 Tax=Treponema parvum TaxID=138851 RepID=UPI001AEC1919|nr:UPF0164 family protein [Treponema parvum]QTQ16083.1 UPF0164 family protein [Treponema parvum]